MRKTDFFIGFKVFSLVFWNHISFPIEQTWFIKTLTVKTRFRKTGFFKSGWPVSCRRDKFLKHVDRFPIGNLMTTT